MCRTTRINKTPIGQAAAAQVVAVATAMAEARRQLRAAGVPVASPLASNALNPCALCIGDNGALPEDGVFGVASTAWTVYNACPVKVTSVSVLTTCRELARGELEHYLISNAMGTRNVRLENLCKSVLGEHTFDPVWSAWVLVVYLTSNPRGRDILRTTGLTDLDVQSALTFVRYGSEEIGRRQPKAGAKRAHDGGTKTKRAKHHAEGAASSEADETDAEAEGEGESDADGARPPTQAPSKRKRAARGHAGMGGSDADAILHFWNEGLGGRENTVLHTFAAHNKRTARDAAISTLVRQAEGTGVAENELLQQISLRNAVKSVSALVAFAGRRVAEIPALVSFRARQGGDGPYGPMIGMQRTEREGANTALHACVLPPRALRADGSVGIAVAWSVATQKLMPRSAERAVLPGVFERCYEIQRILHGGSVSTNAAGHVNGRDAKDLAALEGMVRGETDCAVPAQATGTARSFLSIRTELPVNHTHAASARALFEEGMELYEAAKAAPSAPVAHELAPTWMSTSKRDAGRSEPVCTPASGLAVGLGANETLRRWMAQKTRRNDQCIKHLGLSSPAELSREVPGIMSSEPLPLLTLTDVEVETLGAPRPTQSGRLDRMMSVEAAVGLHVCGDGATRVPELLEALHTAGLSPSEHAQQSRAALLVAASQASFIGAVGSALSAGYTNVAIASSKKISVSDVNKLFLLSPMDAYVAGLTNIQRCFDKTAYSGTYGCRIDTGWTMPGLLAHNLRSDKRQHGARYTHSNNLLNPRQWLDICTQATAPSPRRWRTSCISRSPSRTLWSLRRRPRAALRRRATFRRCRLPCAASRTTTLRACTSCSRRTPSSWRRRAG